MKKRLNAASYFCVVALLLVTGVGAVQGQKNQLREVSTKLASASEAERCQAILELSENNSEESSRLLLKQLKKNLSSRQGYYVKYDSVNTSYGMLMTATRSENELLVGALGKRKYKPALATFLKMIERSEKWLGVSKEFLAANIYHITSEPQTYSVNGDSHVYPEPDSYSDLMPSFLLPAPGELAWGNDNPNRQFRDIVSILGEGSGPFDNHPMYKTLRDEFGWMKLVERVKGDDPLLRPYAVEALGILNEHREETFALLLTTVEDPNPRVRVRSVRALSRMLTTSDVTIEPAPIVAALTKALHDPEDQVRYYSIAPLARHALSQTTDAKTTREIVTMLVSALSDRATDVRAETARYLGWVGPIMSGVVPSLIHLLKSEKKAVRQAAVNGLGQLLHTKSFQQHPNRRELESQIWEAFRLAARDPASAVRYELADVVGWTAPATRSAVPMLIKLTRDPSSGVRTAAARALGNFEIEQARITSALAAMLNVPDEEDEVIDYALSALKELGTSANSAAPELRRLLRNRPRFNNSARDTLEKIGAPQEP